jgi:hypothetical protein
VLQGFSKVDREGGINLWKKPLQRMGFAECTCGETFGHKKVASLFPCQQDPGSTLVRLPTPFCAQVADLGHTHDRQRQEGRGSPGPGHK